MGVNMTSDLNNLLKTNDCRMFYKVVRFEGSHPLQTQEFELGYEAKDFKISFNESEWQPTIKAETISEGVVDLKVTFKLLKGICLQTNLGVGLRFGKWSADNYVLMPAAAYNGNRFQSRKIEYAPILTNQDDLGVDKPIVITDVPRLNIEKGPSRIQQLTRDLATPAVGFRSALNKRGFWMLTTQETALGDSGIEIDENDDRSEASILLTAPGVRYDRRYIICNMDHPCDDRGTDFNEGDTVELNMRLYFFDCPGLQNLFDYFVNIRKDLTGTSELSNSIPFYSAWEIQEKKYNEQNWEGELGYYSVGMRENIHQDWQVGWVGGMMATYPLLFEGNEISKQRVLKNFDFLFDKGQDRSGFFHGCGHKGEWYGDNFRDLSAKWHLLRKSADALYYLIKQFMLMEKQNIIKPKANWLEGTRKCADAFVKLWKTNGQLGQFVDSETGDIILGGSASAGIAPAGLALAWKYFGEEEYIKVAAEVAQYYYKNFVQKGYTLGGPGEICQCPDSESAFGLLESYIVLYETTGEDQWKTIARDMANQCFTWCVSYDFNFPKLSTFGKLRMHTTGSVYANVQNKHSAPGICTLSGDSLFKLYRATGDLKYLELIREMAHNLPQYLSRNDRPIPGLAGNWALEKIGEYLCKDMPAGWMSERVQMSDWLEPVGEVFAGSCWCEVSNMLAYTEVPGLYVQIDTGLVCAIDHIEAEVIEKTQESIKLKLYNPTDYKASVKVLAERSGEMSKPLGQNVLFGCKRIELAPKESKVVELSC
jgi:hypothetical protein